ncbi:unnamed protein product [Gongylonema pulchrum]|uniref:Uncharacterized protein n=1 Tax=Gongylonema pulchrum TaxID=637853 RepID=A0A183ECK4_9BILA|nr:unnamed protein product [Gongylonema pulchrum]
MKKRYECPLCHRATSHIVQIGQSGLEAKTPAEGGTFKEFEAELAVHDEEDGKSSKKVGSVTVAHASCHETTPAEESSTVGFDPKHKALNEEDADAGYQNDSGDEFTTSHDTSLDAGDTTEEEPNESKTQTDSSDELLDETEYETTDLESSDSEGFACAGTNKHEGDNDDNCGNRACAKIVPPIQPIARGITTAEADHAVTRRSKRVARRSVKPRAKSTSKVRKRGERSKPAPLRQPSVTRRYSAK